MSDERDDENESESDWREGAGFLSEEDAEMLEEEVREGLADLDEDDEKPDSQKGIGALTGLLSDVEGDPFYETCPFCGKKKIGTRIGEHLFWSHIEEIEALIEHARRCPSAPSINSLIEIDSDDS